MTTLHDIEDLASKGFHLFQLQANGKKPAVESFTERSTTDVSRLKKEWTDPVMGVVQPFNIGIATSVFNGGDSALLVVDVDTKKQGFDTLNMLELSGQEFPPTWAQRTPSGGLHLIYRVAEAVKQGVDVLGRGIDVRSRGGYIVGAGSEIDGIKYTLDTGNPLADAPDWIIQKCNEKVTEKRETKKGKFKIDSAASVKRVTDYLRRAKPAIEGEGGDEHTFKVISRCKDLGVSEDKALDLLIEHWNPKCQPPWHPEELRLKIENAFVYGQNDPGADAPEADFEVAADPTDDDDAISPVEKLNLTYSFVVLGGCSTILRKLDDGEIAYMKPSAFHDLLRCETIFVDKRWRQLSEVWMESRLRSTYERIALLPEQETPKGTYNLWQGFCCEPLGDDEEPTAKMTQGVAMFKEHMFENVCDKNPELYKWLMGYFAHMIQYPWKKPSTALVFKGKKGVGKNALIDRIGNLFKPHYLLTSNKRYVTSNFNNHLARLLLFVLDEAFWSGDKSAEGILKDLVTGNHHLIEQKGREMYEAKNLTRVVVIGNEDWIVPASVDERRFAVFNVGSKRKEDTEFFAEMRRCLEKHDGNRLLLRELKAFDLSGINLNKAPATEGLLEQKIESLSPLYAWWYQSLQDGQICEMDFTESGWPAEVSRQRIRDAFQTYTRQRGIRSWLPSAFGKQLKKACPSLEDKRAGDRVNRFWAYTLPSLKVAREEFETFMRHKMEWTVDEESELFS